MKTRFHPRLTILGALCLAASAAGATGARLSEAQLEDRFWQCDALATHRALPADVGVQCAAWTDELKQRRFGGDFNAFLAWWQARKAAEHARRAGALASRSHP